MEGLERVLASFQQIEPVLDAIQSGMHACNIDAHGSEFPSKLLTRSFKSLISSIRRPILSSPRRNRSARSACNVLDSRFRGIDGYLLTFEMTPSPLQRRLRRSDRLQRQGRPPHHLPADAGEPAGAVRGGGA